MPGYCSPEDVGRFGVNAKAIEGISAEDEIQPVIDSVSETIDGYLKDRFVLPLVSFGQDIRRCCAIIVAFEVLSVRGFRPGTNPEDEILTKRYDGQIRFLENIAKGLIVPNVKDSSPGATQGVSPKFPTVTSDAGRGYQNESGSDLPFSGRRR